MNRWGWELVVFLFVCPKKGRCSLILRIATLYIVREEINEFQRLHINGRAVIWVPIGTQPLTCIIGDPCV
jgi:hypothetical protein